MSCASDISQQAAEWFALMVAGDPTAQEEAQFRQWLEVDAGHRRAYAEFERLWAGAGALPELAARSPAGGLSRRAVLRGGLAAGLAAIAAVGGGAWMAETHLLADHRTGIGERRTVRLPDGSVAELSAATALSVWFGASERRVDLHGGEAFFTVAPDASRPFSVIAGGGGVTALGTAFSVATGPQDTRVVVTEHAVSVAHGGTAVRVAEGQGVHYGATGLSEVVPTDPALSLSWRQGRLAFMSVPLAEVLDAISRWRPGRVVVLDEGLRARPVTVILDIARADVMLDILAQALPIRVTTFTPYLTLIRPV